VFKRYFDSISEIKSDNDIITRMNHPTLVLEISCCLDVATIS